MPAEDRQREYRREMLLASALIAAGLAISALALTVLNTRDPLQIAQATQPTQSTPGAETKPSSPSEPALAARAGHDRPKALGHSAATGPSRSGRAEGGCSARAAAGAGGEGCAADPREVIPLPSLDCAIAKCVGGQKPAARVLMHQCAGNVTPSIRINLYEAR